MSEATSEPDLEFDEVRPDTPPPENPGPAASEEDFEPEDPDIEAVIDEEE